MREPLHHRGQLTLLFFNFAVLYSGVFIDGTLAFSPPIPFSLDNNASSTKSQQSDCHRTTATSKFATMSNVETTQQFKVLGVCGGIGSGKSSACKLLVSELGCLSHLDADKIAHAVYEPGCQAVHDIVQEFGKEILQEKGVNEKEEIDRKKLGAIVFADRSAMSKLERIVWPHVKEELQVRINRIREEWLQKDDTTTEQGIVIVEAAVLLDANWEDLLDGIWVVTTSKELALERLMTTRNLSQEDATKRIMAQESRRGIGNLQEEMDNGIVTATIPNNGSLQELQDALKVALESPTSWKKAKE